MREIIRNVLQKRQEEGIVRNNFLDYLNAIRKNEKHNFEEDDILAQSITFYLDGFETSSTALTFTLYEIAANKHVQVKLKEEIDRVLTKYSNNIAHEALQEMEYLDCVLNGKSRTRK